MIDAPEVDDVIDVEFTKLAWNGGRCFVDVVDRQLYEAVGLGNVDRVPA